MIRPIAKCGQCGSVARRYLTSRDINQAMTGERFVYYRCLRCRLVFLDPIPVDLGRYYPSGYHKIPASIAELEQGNQHERYKLEAIGVEGRGRALLEIGPSHGKFAHVARQVGYDVSAIEMDPDCCRFLRDVVGIRVVESSDVAGALASLGKFDVIALWHSIEHLPNPWPLLDGLADHLSAGGLVAIASPNPQALQFRLFGPYWVHLDAPRHVMLIPPAIIEARLARHGLRRTLLTTTDQGARDCNGMSWVHSPRRRFPGWMFGEAVAPIRVRLDFRLKRLETKDPHGSAYTIVMRRD